MTNTTVHHLHTNPNTNTSTAQLYRGDVVVGNMVRRTNTPGWFISLVIGGVVKDRKDQVIYFTSPEQGADHLDSLR